MKGRDSKSWPASGAALLVDLPPNKRLVSTILNDARRPRQPAPGARGYRGMRGSSSPEWRRGVRPKPRLQCRCSPPGWRRRLARSLPAGAWIPWFDIETTPAHRPSAMPPGLANLACVEHFTAGLSCRNTAAKVSLYPPRLPDRHKRPAQARQSSLLPRPSCVLWLLRIAAQAKMTHSFFGAESTRRRHGRATPQQAHEVSRCALRMVSTESSGVPEEFAMAATPQE